MKITGNRRASLLSAALCMAIFLFLSRECFSASVSHMDDVIEGNNRFALELYGKLSQSEENIFFSPFSISTAMAMTYAGAGGSTAEQMENALHFGPNGEHLHASFSNLMRNLYPDRAKGVYELSIANALWGQKGFSFRRQFIDITKRYYDAGFKETDFRKKAEHSRKTINRWVENNTKGRIKDLLPQGSVDELTRLILTNAVYFKGRWEARFDERMTSSAQFELTTKEQKEVLMMRQSEYFNYFADEIIQVLEMPYKGQRLSMVVLLPAERTGIKSLEEGLNNDNLTKWLAALKRREVDVYIPRFTMSSEFVLNKALMSLGLTDAFKRDRADFSGMSDDEEELYISVVVHKAFVDVNEEGTEAAAATGVVMKLTSAGQPNPVFRADHPFIFFIRDIPTGSILFMGRVMDPCPKRNNPQH